MQHLQLFVLDFLHGGKMKLTIYRDEDGVINMIKIGDYVFDVDEIENGNTLPMEG